MSEYSFSPQILFFLVIGSLTAEKFSSSHFEKSQNPRGGNSVSRGQIDTGKGFWHVCWWVLDRLWWVWMFLTPCATIRTRIFMTHLAQCPRNRLTGPRFQERDLHAGWFLSWSSVSLETRLVIEMIPNRSSECVIGWASLGQADQWNLWFRWIEIDYSKHDCWSQETVVPSTTEWSV